MVRSLEFIRPEGIPYTLLSFQFYFENENSHWINIYHAAGMHLVYNITKICYLLPQNEFYELLLLQNTEEIHVQKYNWLLMKGIFGGIAQINARLTIENEEAFNRLHPENHLDKECLRLHRLPEIGNDIVINGVMGGPVFYHFFCNDIRIDSNEGPSAHLFYLNSYNNVDQILDLWFDENDQPKNRDF